MECRFWLQLREIGFKGRDCPFENQCESKKMHPENIIPLVHCQAAISENLISTAGVIELSPEELIKEYRKRNSSS